MKKVFYKQIINNLSLAYAYHKIILDSGGKPCDYIFIDTNKAFHNLTGISEKNIKGAKVTKILPEIVQSEVRWIEIYGKIALEGGIEYFDGYSNPIKKHFKVTVFSPRKMYFVTIFTELKDSEKELLFELKESERSKSVLLSNLPGMAFRCNYDREWTMKFVSDGCYDLTGYTKESLINNRDLSFNDLISAEYREYLWLKWNKAFTEKSKFIEEYEIITKKGEKKWVWEQGQVIYDNKGEAEAVEGFIIDITDRKKKELEISFLNNFDYLTGVYNRRCFEKAKAKLNRLTELPLSVIMGDINGVKFINDAFGHREGDNVIIKVADILKKVCRKGDVLARTGGDEFIILLPKTDKSIAYEIIDKVKDKIIEHNEKEKDDYYLSISLGCATKERLTEDINIVLKRAEDNMYKSKLLEQKSSHSAILSSIKSTMFERSQETEAHAERMKNIALIMGVALDLSPNELHDLSLLATLHDIGKIAIDDRILNKPSSLTPEEWEEMKTHSEIGYRITMSSKELSCVADYILYHHESWNGTGYPRGLKGKEIPLLSRIIAIVDAYDAMISDRPYRKGLSKAEAIKEIEANSGKQFDPNLVAVFLEKIQDNI